MAKLAKKSLVLALPVAVVLLVSVWFSVSVFGESPPAKAAAAAPATAQAGTPAPAGTPGGAPTPGAANGAQAAVPLTEPEILGVVDAVDQHEIDAAKAAMKRKLGAEAKGFAKMLREQHTENMAKGKKLSKKLGWKPATSKTAEDLKAKGAEEIKTLSAIKDDKEFEKAYIDAMVNGHPEALQLIDEKLIPVAQNADFKAHLTEARGHVAAHLEQGKRLQGARASTAP